MNILLTFLYVFNFRMVQNLIITESSLIVGCVMIMRLFARDDYDLYASRLVSSRQNKTICKYMLTLMGLAAIFPCVFMTFDFSYLSILVHQFVCLEIGVLLLAYLKYKKIDLLKTIINTFFAQSIIQVISFFSESFLSLTDIFRDAATIAKREESYVGFRGLSIAGSGFFGLAVGYGIVFTMLGLYWDKWKEPKNKKILVLLFLAAGALFAGRTSILGIAVFGILRIIPFLKNNRINRKVFISSIIAVSVIVIIGSIFGSRIYGIISQNSALEGLKYYWLQLFTTDDNNFSYVNRNIRNVTSLMALFEQYNQNFKFGELIFGSGHYTVNNLYYLGVDSGFLRNLLFWGLIPTALLYFYQWKILALSKRADDWKKILLVYLVLLVYEYKGQTMGFLIVSQAVLIFFSMNNDLYKNDEVAKYGQANV